MHATGSNTDDAVMLASLQPRYHAIVGVVDCVSHRPAYRSNLFHCRSLGQPRTQRKRRGHPLIAPGSDTHLRTPKRCARAASEPRVEV